MTAPERAERGGAPIRTCIGCRRTGARGELLRFVLRDGEVVADPGRSLPGRGAWLHDDPACRAAAAKRGAFSRAFRRTIPQPPSA